jgi:hypothetical protein
MRFTNSANDIVPAKRPGRESRRGGRFYLPQRLLTESGQKLLI